MTTAMTSEELDTYRLLYGRDPPNLQVATLGASVAATRAGVDFGQDDGQPDVCEPVGIAQVDSETLKETLLGAVALAHARVIAGKFGSGAGEQAGLEKLLALVRDFPDLAKALDTVAAYERPASIAPATAANVAAAAPVVSETVRRLRAMGYGK